MKIVARARSYRFERPFRTSLHTYVAADVVEVTASVDGVSGRGEGAGVDYDGETQATMLAQIQAAVPAIVAAGDGAREIAQTVLPAGGARNAVDCALWDLAAKQQGTTAFALTGMVAAPVRTAITIGLDTPEAMACEARAFADDALIKLKLGGATDLDRLRAVRSAAPEADLIVDANQGWTIDDLLALEAALVDARVLLVEQPLPVGDDQALRGRRYAIPLCADESCSDRASLPALDGKYDFVNIKLDKTGGLTEALAVARDARSLGFRLMVGCMGGSSLCIAPALVIAGQCAFVDLDCPLQLAQDVDHALIYDGHRLGLASPQLWG